LRKKENFDILILKMEQDIERKIIGILKVLSETETPVGANIIAKNLQKYGIFLNGRTVRYHLKIMDERGLTKKIGREGRTITEKGKEELKNALVSDRIGMIISKIDNLSYKVDFSLEKRKGNVIVNTGVIQKNKLDEAVAILKKVINSKISLSKYIVIKKEGEKIGNIVVPSNKCIIGTLCSITINGILIKAGIPTIAKFGGVIEVQNYDFHRFTDIITYDGSTLDPLEIFMRSDLVSILSVLKTGSGKVLANYREIPAQAKEKAKEIINTLENIGISGKVYISEPGQQFLGIQSTPDKIGIVVMGGLNAFSALEESGIKTEPTAISTVINFEEMEKIGG
jgi:repressor of nif and glnA expression